MHSLTLIKPAKVLKRGLYVQLLYIELKYNDHVCNYASNIN